MIGVGKNFRVEQTSLINKDHSRSGIGLAQEIESRKDDIKGGKDLEMGMRGVKEGQKQ